MRSATLYRYNPTARLPAAQGRRRIALGGFGLRRLGYGSATASTGCCSGPSAPASGAGSPSSNDHMLRDIGLSRADVMAEAHQALLAGLSRPLTEGENRTHAPSLPDRGRVHRPDLRRQSARGAARCAGSRSAAGCRASRASSICPRRCSCCRRRIRRTRAGCGSSRPRGRCRSPAIRRSAAALVLAATGALELTGETTRITFEEGGRAGPGHDPARRRRGRCWRS